MTADGPPWDIFVVTAPGLEDITRDELVALDVVPDAVQPGGLSLRGDAGTLETLHLHLRTASRILVRVARFRAVGFRDLERHARDIPWREFVPPGTPVESVALDVTCRKSRLYHSGAVEERLRQALRRVLATVGPAPAPRRSGSESGSPTSAPVRFVVRLHRNRLSLSVDASGHPLHRRGYREAIAKAPLRETLGAAMLLASGWRGDIALGDPFCGSGTIPIEATLLALGIPPGAGRRFAFRAWPCLDAAPGGSEFLPSGWESRAEVAASTAESVALPPILGSDRDAGAVQAAQANARRAGVVGRIDFTRASLSEAPFPGPGGLVLTNPPYGHRVGRQAGLRNLYARLGDRLRADCPGGRVVLLSADPVLAGQLGVDTRVLFRCRNGGIPVEALEADLP